MPVHGLFTWDYQSGASTLLQNWDTNRDGAISLASEVHGREDLLDAADAIGNRDGWVTRDELVNGLAYIDQNGDGLVNLQELTAAKVHNNIANQAPNGGAMGAALLPAGREGHLVDSILGAVVSQLDQDGDSAVNLAYEMPTHPAGRQFASGVVHADMAGNRDGVASFDEMRRFIAYYDTDRNGALQGAELQQLADVARNPLAFGANHETVPSLGQPAFGAGLLDKVSQFFASFGA